jgi:GNAT superfamily N-acetyltransferase
MLTIRKACRSDLKTLVSLWKEFAKYNAALAPANKALRPHLKRRRDAAKKFAVWSRKYIGSKNGVVFLAEMDGRPVGYSLVFIKRNPLTSRISTLGYISDLFVREDFRGKGISSKLTNEVIKWFRRKGIRHLSLHVLEVNHVPRSIYKRWGFFPFVIEMRKDL